MAFEVTTSLRKMLDMKARKKVIQGATSSGKTYGIIPIIYDKCLATPRLKSYSCS
jgi:phage terminase large subunit